MAGRRARRAGRAARDASVAHHGGPQDLGTGRARLLEFVPLGRPRAQRRRAAACGDAPARLADHAGRRCQPGARGRRLGGRPRRLRGRRSPPRSMRIRSIDIRARGDRRTAAADWDSVIVATGPLTSPALADAIAKLTGRGRARVLRRHRSDRASRHDRHVGRLAAVALRQGGARRIGRRLHQLPAHARAVRRLRGCAARRRQGGVPRLGRHDALFRRLSADRGDGRARAAKRCVTAR